MGGLQGGRFGPLTAMVAALAGFRPRRRARSRGRAKGKYAAFRRSRPDGRRFGLGPAASYRSGTKGWPRQAGVFVLVRSRFPEIATRAAMVMR